MGKQREKQKKLMKIQQQKLSRLFQPINHKKDRSLMLRFQNVYAGRRRSSGIFWE